MPVSVIARDDESAEFFDATAQGTLVVQSCATCGHLQYPLTFAPAVIRCRNCGSAELSWVPVAGNGSLVTWTHIHRRPRPDGTPAPVTTVGVVELDEGPWVYTQLRSVPDELHAGDRVQVAFERADGGEALPVFEPSA